MKTVKVCLKDWRVGTPGTITEVSEPFARDLVAAGGAEYVIDAPKAKPFPEGRGRRDKMLRTVGGTT